MARWMILLVAVSCVNCATMAERSRADAKTVAVIRDDMDRVCGGDRCELGDCWDEAPGLVACRVELSLAGGWSSVDLLEKLHTDLKTTRSINAGFCGQPSAGSELAAALVVIVIIVVLAALVQGSSHSSSRSSFSPPIISSSQTDYVAIGLGEQGEAICRQSITFPADFSSTAL